MYKKISSYADEEVKYHHVCYNYKNQLQIQPHTHDTLELIFLKKGDITYDIDEKSYKLKDNSLIITKPHKIHSILVNNSCDYDRYVFLFDRNIVPPDVYDSLPDGIDVLIFQSPQRMIRLYEKLDYYYDFFEGNQYKRLLMHVIEEVFCNISILLQVHPEAAVYSLYKVNDMLAEAIRYIEGHVTKEFTLDEMSRELHISKSYLHKLFSQNLNVTPKKYLVSRRLALAQMDLLDKQKPTEVCLKYGYKDYSTFYREYRKYFGVAPSQEVERKLTREIID